MAVRGRRLFTLGVGALTFLVIRKPSKQQRRRARRDAIYASYDRAGAEPKFVTEMRELESDFDATGTDGLDEPIQEAIALHAVWGDDDEFTTSQAARLLGMSRPALVALLDRGELPFRMVGTHRRLPAAAVLAFRRRSERRAPRTPSREEQLRGLEEMAEMGDALGLGY
ncbi:MAG TPA: excisionase family DNA-binding protein [Longimicrobium sp.]|jgi:excisionase family DNA binding protein|nr:excisionase family DNA-binding protein [Longimicrobium sp.]